MYRYMRGIASRIQAKLWNHAACKWCWLPTAGPIVLPWIWPRRVGWSCHGTPAVCLRMRRLFKFHWPQVASESVFACRSELGNTAPLSVNSVVLNVLKDEDAWEVRIEEFVMGRARPATNIWYCVENGITDTSKKKNRPSLYGYYYFGSLCKAKTRSLAKISIHCRPPTPLIRRMLASCICLLPLRLRPHEHWDIISCTKARTNAFPSQSFPCLSIRKYLRPPQPADHLPPVFPGSNKKNARRRRSAIRLACLNAQRGRT